MFVPPPFVRVFVRHVAYRPATANKECRVGISFDTHQGGGEPPRKPTYFFAVDVSVILDPKILTRAAVVAMLRASQPPTPPIEVEGSRVDGCDRRYRQRHGPFRRSPPIHLRGLHWLADAARFCQPRLMVSPTPLPVVFCELFRRSQLLERLTVGSEDFRSFAIALMFDSGCTVGPDLN